MNEDSPRRETLDTVLTQKHSRERQGRRRGSRKVGGRSSYQRTPSKHLFQTIKNPKTGEPYTSAEVARMSAGVLTEEDVKGIRSGRISDPLVSQVAALAAVFGVPPSYLLDRSKESSVLDEEVLENLADETAGAILRESARLPEREKEIVLGIVRQFGNQIDDA